MSAELNDLVITGDVEAVRAQLGDVESRARDPVLRFFGQRSAVQTAAMSGRAEVLKAEVTRERPEIMAGGL